MNAFLQTLRNLGPARLAAMGGVSAALVGFFIYLMVRLTTPEMALLYGDLDLTDSGAIAARLDQMKVPYAVEGDGASISVPMDQVDRLRVAMAQEGLPSGGSIGYEIFDQADGFGTTTFVQNINRVRAMEGELARTIGTIENVRAARVHLVLPERQLFSREEQKPSASVFLQIQGRGLSSAQVVAIQHLVAAAVPKMEPQNISIVDGQGTLLARGPEGDAESLRIQSTEEMRRSYEEKLKNTVEQLLSRSVGYGRVRAQVTVDMDFDRITTSEERYDPNSQVARSTQFVEEMQESTEGSAIDPVSIATNLPEADVPGLGGGGGGAGTSASRTEETTNYEISRIVQNTVRETGSVRRLSVAVLVDGHYQPTDGGGMEYMPRPAEEMAQLEALVRSAIGFDQSRGDTLEVVNMRFVSEDLAPTAPPAAMFGMQRDDLFRLAEMLVLAVVALLVILLVVRPLLGRVLDGAGRAAPSGDGIDGLLPDPMAGLQQVAIAGPAGSMPALAGPSFNAPATTGNSDGRRDAADEIEALIDLDQVEGRVRASSLKKVGEIVEKHPEEAVSIIRNWMYQET